MRHLHLTGSRPSEHWSEESIRVAIALGFVAGLVLFYFVVFATYLPQRGG